MLRADAEAGVKACSKIARSTKRHVARARGTNSMICTPRATPLTTEPLCRTAELYAVEAEIQGKPPDKRRQVQQARSCLRLADLERWLRTTLDTLSRKSDAATATLYALKLCSALLRYCEDGAIAIDNSAAEHAFRGVAIGGPNSLFAGADCGGERAAAIYSLIGTAKLNGVAAEA